MWAAKTFVNIAQLTIMKLEIPRSPHSPIARDVASAWSGNDQLCLKSAASTGVKRVHVNSIDVEGTVFQTFQNYKQRSCIQFITNEQVKLISFI